MHGKNVLGAETGAPGGRRALAVGAVVARIERLADGTRDPLEPQRVRQRLHEGSPDRREARSRPPFVVGTEGVRRYFTVMAQCAAGSKLRGREVASLVPEVRAVDQNRASRSGRRTKDVCDHRAPRTDFAIKERSHEPSRQAALRRCGHRRQRPARTARSRALVTLAGGDRWRSIAGALRNH
jgi:hypothetical protein